MKRILLLFLFQYSFVFFAQNQQIHSVHFNVGKHLVDEAKRQELIDFAKNTDSSKVESIAILGYCDDRGSAEFNLKLSNKRANEIRKILNTAGVKHKIIVNIQGKGKVPIPNNSTQEEIEEIRQKNRRVDVIITQKNIYAQIPNVKYYITEKTKLGDRIFLKSVEFPLDRSILTPKAIKELDIIAQQLKKYNKLHVEIQGHICCTIGSREAIDRDTGKKDLSTNRAKAVYNYLIKKKIDPKRLRFKGYGNYFPLGFDPELDKRVEFLITRS